MLERDAKVVGRHLNGERFVEIAPDFGLTPERIRQIVRRAGIAPATSRATRRGRRNGRRRPDKRGYMLTHYPDHPRADRYGYVFEHIVVAEDTLGRAMRPGEVVHHRNGRRGDNTPSNLQVMDESDHLRLHNLRYTDEMLLVLYAWVGLRLGHTPRQIEMVGPDFPPSWTPLCGRIGKARASVMVGLVPTTRGHRPCELTRAFKIRWQSLRRYTTAEALLSGEFGGPLTEHERRIA